MTNSNEQNVINEVRKAAGKGSGAFTEDVVKESAGWGQTSDGWDDRGGDLDTLMSNLDKAEQLSYEMKNARRGSYALDGDTLRDLYDYVESLADGFSEAANEIYDHIDEGPANQVISQAKLDALAAKVTEWTPWHAEGDEANFGLSVQDEYEYGEPDGSTDIGLVRDSDGNLVGVDPNGEYMLTSN